MNSMSNCIICGVSASLKCGSCKNVVYCGKDHQKVHWKNGHKTQCKCVEIAKNNEIGRHYVAARDIMKNEIIIRESPIVQGPKIVSQPICLGCNKNLSLNVNETNFYKCSLCGWPLCSKLCEKSSNHIEECKLMSKANIKCPINYVDEERKESIYCAIVPLRCLIMKQKQPKNFQAFMELEDHLQERRDTQLYNIFKLNLVGFIRSVMADASPDEETILKIAAILDTNAFEIRPYNCTSKFRAIFPIAAMCAHDCRPNTRHVFDENFNILIIANVDIPKGSIIHVTYTQTLQSTLERREHLKLSKCFDCQCARCSDPTEFNTHIGAINCSRCKLGKVLSTSPLNVAAAWKCQSCDHEITAKQIVWGNNAIKKEIQLLNKKSPKEFEEFLIKYSETLHPHNTHAVQIKYALTQLYGNVAGFYYNDLTDAALQRKIDLCYELLELSDIFEPGYSHFRGKVLLDLQASVAVQTKREFNNNLLTKDRAQEKLMESMTLLQEAIEILKVEPGMKTILEESVKKLTSEISE